MMNKRYIGSVNENKACDFLIKKGYLILDVNYNVRQAELDIIARDDKTVVFVEVKYRSSFNSGNPLEAVTVSKQKKICKAALFYMNQHNINPYEEPVRFDVIGITPKEIMHVVNAFDYIN